MELSIGGFPFTYICDIQPEEELSGSVKIYLPQSRYKNSEHLALNNYGQGPFCKFKIPNHHHQCGVYALVSDEDVMYIGETIDLSRRYNLGYGIISPKNCFVGGQETNCRINHLILQLIQTGKRLSLWFYPTAKHKEVESKLRASIHTPWNR